MTQAISYYPQAAIQNPAAAKEPDERGRTDEKDALLLRL